MPDSNHDITTIAQGVQKLGDDGQEVSLCLLNSLWPYQLRLDAARTAPTPEVIGQLADDFTDYLTQLRDALLGG